MKRYIRKLWVAILKVFHKEECFKCGWGIARYQNEITLPPHIGVIGLRCNACQAKHDLKEGSQYE